MQSRCFSSTLIGIEARLVRVEVAVSHGLPGLTVVGLPDASVSEAGARVRSALRASGFSLPPRRIVVNLSPADLRKQGSGFDLALALGLLEALEEIPSGCLARSAIVGELSLDGTIRPVKGLVPVLNAACSSEEVDSVLFAFDQREAECAMESLQLLPLRTLREAVQVLKGEAAPSPWMPPATVRATEEGRDLAEVQGQEMARWALEISAAGGHHLMMVGPPGCGKSLLASCLPGILPPMTSEERFEVLAVASVCQEEIAGALRRPFRSPGQATSAVAMLGGQQPGEVTRAHRGVLFLDEFPEFRRDTLEALRQVMETGNVSVVRARLRVVYPARFTLLAAMNPCPCGLFSESSDACRCSEGQRLRYAGKLSGPLRDRFDLLVGMERQPLSAFLGPTHVRSESSDVVRGRVVAARAAQLARGALNRDLRGERLRASLGLGREDESFCEATGDRLKFSVRGLEKWLKIARTVADLDGAEKVTRRHLMTSLVLRSPSA